MHSLLKLQQGLLLRLQPSLLRKLHQKRTPLTLSSWLPCHQRSRLRFWSSRGGSAAYDRDSGNNSSKQLLQLCRAVEPQHQLQAQVQRWTWPPF